MGARGPAPQPTNLKILRGNPGKRAINKREPKPRPIVPKCPHWLDLGARREWRRVAPELERIGLLTLVDLAVMAAYCQSFSRWQAAEELIAKAGLLIKTGSDRYTAIKTNPAVKIAQDERQLMMQFGARLGLSPSDRSRMTLPDGDSTDEDGLD